MGTSLMFQSSIRRGAGPSFLLAVLLCLVVAGCSGSSSPGSLEGVADSPEGKASASIPVPPAPAPSSEADSLGLTVVFASNIDGEIEPCG